MRSPFRLASVLLLAFLFVMNIYRAATQSITHDEALTYSWFVSEPWDVVFNKYDANHHVLFTILCKLVVSVFGATSFVMRLPTLAACVLYFWVLIQFCELIFGSGWLLLLAVAALSLNPLLLDFLSAARGYGMALAFFLTALYLLLRFLREPDRAARNKKLLVWSGLAFAASVCSNLTYLVPITGAILTALAMYWLDQLKTPAASRTLSVSKAARLLVAPFVFVSWIILIFPLSAASPDHFYYGAHAWKDAADSLVVFSFLNLPAYYLLTNSAWLRQVSFGGMALVIVGVVAFAIAAIFRWSRLHAPDRALILIAGITASSLGAIAAGFYLANIVLPVGRTGIYWIFLLTLAGLLIIRFAPGPRWVSWLLTIPLLVVLAQYALELRTTFYAEWLFHRNCRAIVDYIVKDHARLGNRQVIVGGSWGMAAPVNFYRETEKLTWMAPMERRDDLPQADYWTFVVQQTDEVEKRGLKIVWKDPLSGTLLAVPSSAALPAN